MAIHTRAALRRPCRPVLRATASQTTPAANNIVCTLARRVEAHHLQSALAMPIRPGSSRPRVRLGLDARRWPRLVVAILVLDDDPGQRRLRGGRSGSGRHRDFARVRTLDASRRSWWSVPATRFATIRFACTPWPTSPGRRRRGHHSRSSGGAPCDLRRTSHPPISRPTSAHKKLAVALAWRTPGTTTLRTARF